MHISRFCVGELCSTSVRVTAHNEPYLREPVGRACLRNVTASSYRASAQASFEWRLSLREFAALEAAAPGLWCVGRPAGQRLRLLVGIGLDKVGRICTEIAPLVDLNTDSARTVLRTAHSGRSGRR